MKSRKDEYQTFEKIFKKIGCQVVWDGNNEMTIDGKYKLYVNNSHWTDTVSGEKGQGAYDLRDIIAERKNL